MAAPRAALEEVPHFDDVALEILDVQGPVAAVVLDRPSVRVTRLLQPRGEAVEAARPGGEGVVHVAPALVAELLLAGEPQAQARVLAGGEPHAVVLAREDLEAEDARVEAL